MIVSLDMHMMNAIKWVDRENMLVCMEAGIIGQDVKRRLEALGFAPHPSHHFTSTQSINPTYQSERRLIVRICSSSPIHPSIHPPIHPSIHPPLHLPLHPSSLLSSMACSPCPSGVLHAPNRTAPFREWRPASPAFSP